MRQNLFDSILEACVINKTLYSRAGTATSVAGAATMTQQSGRITTESLSTAAQGTFVLTVTCPGTLPTDMIFCTRVGGTSTTGFPVFNAVAGTNSYVINVTNVGTAAFNGTLIIGVYIVKSAT